MTTNARGTTAKGFETPENEVDFYRRMIDFTTDVISKHSPEGVFLFVSQACRDLLGYEPEELVGHDAYSFQHMDDIADVRVSHREILKAPIVYTVAYRFRHKKGHYVWVETTSRTVSDPQTGQVEFIICTTRNIALRKKAEAALARRLEMERVISGISIEFLGLESGDLDQGIRRALATIGTICGADRAYVFMFREGGRLADNTHEWCAPGVEPQMDKLQGICIPEELPWFARSVQKHEIFQVTDVSELPPEAQLEQVHFEEQDIRSLIAVPMTLGNELLGFIGFDTVREHQVWTGDQIAILQLFGEIFSNAIRRRRVEIELRRSEERWQFALEGSGDGVWDWDPVSDHIFSSSPWNAMLGYGAEDIGNTLNDWKNKVHADDLASVMADLERHIAGETAIYENEHRILCKDGSYKWILGRGKVIERTPDGQPRRVIGTHTDITARKAAEAEREQLISNLQTALKEVKTLSGLLPICSFCKKIRDDQGYWRRLETYLSEHSNAEFSHSLCRECMEKYYPDFKPDMSGPGRHGPCLVATGQGWLWLHKLLDLFPSSVK